MKRLAVVGGGITGLSCAYKLQNDFEITLFEKEQHVGGQAQTHSIKGINVEAAVSVMSDLTYIEFFKLMEEIGFANMQKYELTGLHVHDRVKTSLYFDINLKRLSRLFPKFIIDTPSGLYRLLQLFPFVYRLYADHRKGKLDSALVLDAYTLYPQYTHLITTVLSILSLITAVGIKQVTISHVLNFAFDFNRNPQRINPISFLIKMFTHTQAPKNGVGEYIQLLKKSCKATVIENSEITRIKRNQDGTLTITDNNNQEYSFDKVIVAAQPFQIASFLDYKCDEERIRFEKLSDMLTYTLVTNHTDDGIINGLSPTNGLVDYRLDHHENCSQVTITRTGHFYTAQTLPESFRKNVFEAESLLKNRQFIDTAITPDNYSIDKSQILSQHIHGVPFMNPETKILFNELISHSGKDNLHFACAAISDYPTSQEGGVRSALRVVEELKSS